MGLDRTTVTADQYDISYEQFLEFKTLYPNLKIIDVRSPEEFVQYKIEGAENIPAARLALEAIELPKTDMYLLYCNKGISSRSSCEQLKKIGFTSVYSLQGGLVALQQAQLLTPSNHSGEELQD